MEEVAQELEKYKTSIGSGARKDNEEGIVDDFYTELERVCDKIPRHDMKVVLGDFNAKIGKEEQNNMVAGKCGLHEETSLNGERLCMFSEAQRLIEREIEEIIRKMRNNKSPGSDTITAEMLKYGGEELLKVIHELISKVWEQERMPEEWKKGLIIPIYKKGDRRDSARSQRAMLEKLEDIERAVSKVGLTINWEKTKYLKMTRMGQRGVDLEVNESVKKVAEWTPGNTRLKGRPRIRWRDDVVADLRKIGARNWREVVEDRPQWRLLIHQAKTHGGL
ncbi:uncharacterized protein LOC124366713 [Homalodisca vitripennis]|uniref:uncharacterized protein LOC124366713 n=1 Tax=Homalodisca vitripennis TaxID=197043 RepID=UPI001EEB2E79|nr:uncharacterized protein LOC124366713 [Homalodisca vitripennis]